MIKPTCRLCNKNYTERGLARHLHSCLPRYLVSSSRNPKEKIFHLHVYAAHDPDYFLHLAVTGWTALEELDSFLRKIWLECCGHLSQFSYGRYGEELKMNQEVFKCDEEDFLKVVNSPRTGTCAYQG